MKSLHYIAKTGYVKFECECGEEGFFYITRGERTKEDNAVIEAACAYLASKYVHQNSYTENQEFEQKLLETVINHPDFKEVK